MPDRLLLDTNLLVLLVVGTAGLGYIARHKRLRAFDATDYGMVLDRVGEFSGLVLNPHVLAETSSLAMQTDEAAKKEIADVLAIVVARHAEFYVESRAAVQRREYRWLGLTDAVLLQLTEAQTTLLTADAGLYVAALRAGKRALNYNHLREQRLDYR